MKQLQSFLFLGLLLVCSSVRSELVQGDGGQIVQGIAPGNYSIQADLLCGTTPENSVVDLPNALTLNGVLLEFDSASGIERKKDGFHATAQTPLIALKNGDRIRIVPRFKGKVKEIRISKTRLRFAPQKIHTTDFSSRKQYYQITGMFGETFKLKVINTAGPKTNAKIEVRIEDFFQNPVGGKTFSADLKQPLEKTFEYRKGGSDQYRAYVRISGPNGEVQTAKYFYLRNCSAGVRRKIWLNNGWLRTSVKDDFTERTRAIQPLPPEHAVWQKVNLPETWPNHLAWFKKEFEIPEAFRNERYFLHIGSLLYEADIYINGKKAASIGIEECVAPAAKDITAYVNAPGKNEIRIAARGRIAALPPEEQKKKVLNRSMNRVMDHHPQGIGEVWLETTPEQIIGDLKITTSLRKKEISVSAAIPANHMLSHRVLFQGKEVVKPFAKTAKWENPVLWGPVEFPLLQLVSELKDRRGNVVDVKMTRFGFREIRADGMNVLWNEKSFRSLSTPFMSVWSWGRGGSRKNMIDLLKKTKDMGRYISRRVYLSQAYPELADEEGILLVFGGMEVSNPSPRRIACDDYWTIKKSNDLAMIRALCNHPSIYTWYIANEFFLYSDENGFRRVRRAVLDAQEADPTRFAESGAEGDLRGTSQVYSVHYPVDAYTLREESTFLPNGFYFRDPDKPFRKGQIIPAGQIKGYGGERWKNPIYWGIKPLIANETGWSVFFNFPDGFTRLAGDRVYESGQANDAAHRLAVKTLIEGQRDAGFHTVVPWRWMHMDDKEFIYPSLDILPIQKYHSFYAGEKVGFDVNIFHDVLKTETLDFYWHLERNGAAEQKGARRLNADFCVTFREKIELNLKHPGEYELVLGIAGKMEKRFPIRVCKRRKISGKNIISADTDLDSRKEELLRRVSRGETVIILARRDYPGWLGAPNLTGRNPSVNFTFRPEHPVLKGISEQELSYWYPDHVTGSKYFRKPAGGNIRTLIEAGGPNGLCYAGLIEIPYGKGCFLLSRLNLDTEKNPVAAKLLENMTTYKSPGFGKTGFIGEASGDFAAYLKHFGTEYENASFETLNNFSVILVDGKTPVTKEQIEKLKRFPGKVYVRSPGRAYGLGMKKIEVHAWRGRAIKTGYFPETAGITNYDLFFRKEPQGENLYVSYQSLRYLLDDMGPGEFVGAEPMVYPVLLAKKGNMIFDNLNWMTGKEELRRKASALFSTLMTNLGVRLKNKMKLEIPQNLGYLPLDLKKYFNRGMIDEKESDGKGSWNDQGPDSDMRKLVLKPGTHVFAGVPFRFDSPAGAIMLSSHYADGGYSEISIPVGKKCEALFWLHTSAWTSGAHHWNMIVEYENGGRTEIRMTGKTNMRDWSAQRPAEPFSNEVNTQTECAFTIPQEKYGKASLYRTVWINPSPETRIARLTLKSMKRAIPAILAITVGTSENEFAAMPAAQREKLHDSLMTKALRLQNERRYREAIAEYETALRVLPGNLMPYHGIGSCYEMLEEYAKAVETYARSLKADINQPGILQLKNSAEEKLRNRKDEK